MFKPYKLWLEETYDDINREVFNNILPSNIRFKIKKNLKLKHKGKKCKIWAYQERDKIVFTHKFPDQVFARNVLAHEMVHVWQDCMNGDVHGKSFKIWRESFDKNGLKLYKCYHKDDDLTKG
jgi:hypothetical protein